MIRIAAIVLAVGVSVMTYAVTRWAIFRQSTTPDPMATEGDPRFFDAAVQMLIVAALGFVAVCVSGYLFSRAGKKARQSDG